MLRGALYLFSVSVLKVGSKSYHQPAVVYVVNATHPQVAKLRRLR